MRQVILNTHSPEVARQLYLEDLVFAERASTGPSSSVSVFRPVAGTWRALAAEQPGPVTPKDRQAVADFIGGSPPHPDMEQLVLEFGTAV